MIKVALLVMLLSLVLMVRFPATSMVTLVVAVSLLGEVF
jgi:hypothetical protein